MLNVVALSIIQGARSPVDTVVVVLEPAPELGTQLGSGLHAAFAPQVRFKLPPVLTYPLTQLKTMKDPFKTKPASDGICSKDVCPVVWIPTALLRNVCN